MKDKRRKGGGGLHVYEKEGGKGRVFEGSHVRPHGDGEEVVGFVGASGAGDAGDEVHDAGDAAAD